MIRQGRSALGKVLLFFDRLTSPQSVTRPAEYQEKVNRDVQKLALYQFESCPFCIKVRRAMKRMNLPIELRDVQENENFKNELVREGGMHQVPCLRIQKEDGSVQWMYESSDIIRYLAERYSE